MPEDEKLIAGYRRFRERTWPERRRRFEQLADRGQNPRALVIACSDSRVDPAMILDAAPGDMFVIRNIAGFVPPYDLHDGDRGTGAAVEYAVKVVAVSTIVVIGHSLCGGVKALVGGVPEQLDDFLGPWVKVASPARRALECGPADPQRACEHETVRLSLRNLMTYPWVAERAGAGTLRLQGAHFDVRSGVLSLLQADGDFAPAG